MFIETIIAVFLLGVIAGVWIVELGRCGPLRDENHALRQQQAERSWDRERDAVNYQAFRNTHRGTPYINPAPTGFERLMADISDNDRWSRKAPDSLPSNVRSIGGER